MKVIATLALAALFIASAAAAPANISEWVGHQRRNFNPDGKGAAAGLVGPAGLATDGKTIYLAENGNNAVRNITLDGVATTMVGGPSDGSYGNTGYWNETSVYSPTKIVFSWDNSSLYVAGSHGIYSLDPATSNSSNKGPSGTTVSIVADANGTLWSSTGGQIYAQWRVADFGRNSQNRHMMFGRTSGFSDGLGLDSQFQYIADIDMHYPFSTDLSQMMLVVADYNAHTIRGAHIGNQSVFTLAGVPGSASFQDGPRGVGMLASPRALTIPRRGLAKYAYVGMTSVIRRVDLVSGELTTIVGKWNAQGLVYSVDPFKAAFGAVRGLMEHDNRLFISLYDFNTIATLELNSTQVFSVSAAVSPSTGIVAIAAMIVASLLL